MAYSIKEIAHLAGISARTIRYYDEIGLLPPASVGENGYRHYDRSSLLTLQQILFYRELDVPLKEIQGILEMPDFNPVSALRNHREALKKRSERLEKLITTIDNTIAMIKGDKQMDAKEILNGFDEQKYAEEAKSRWCDTDQYKQSTKRWNSYTKEQKELLKEEGGRITERMVGNDSDLTPDDQSVQAAVADYLAYLNKYFYTCDAEFLRCLSDMWVTDARFAVNYERIREGGAAFVRDAVHIFCDNQK